MSELVESPAAAALRPGSSVLSLKGRRRPKERAVRVFLAACGVLSILTTVGIVLTLAFEALGFFREVSIISFLTGTKWNALIGPNKTFGVLPLVSGTLMLVGISAAVGVPLGVGTALYLSEYAPPKVRRRLKPALEILAGLPTVVLGYFALMFVTRTILRPSFGAEPYNMLSAGIVVGIMIVPIIASVSEDAMSAVPRALREGAYGLGASRMTVGVRVIVPAALSGIMAGVILAISRAIGETMVVAIAGGSRPVFCTNPLESCQAMTAFIAQVAFGDAQRGTLDYTSIFAVGALLFVMTLALNVFSLRLVRRYRQVY